MEMPTVCYYKTLNLSAGATFEEIRASYKKLVLKYHPDVYMLSENETEESIAKVKTRFEEIKKAYEILSNEDTRL